MPDMTLLFLSRPLLAYSGDPCLPPGCPGFLGFRWPCNGKRDAPIPKTDGRLGVSGLAFSWKVPLVGPLL
eukprot:2733021-Pyramimonas_sp.AAC.1